MGSRQTAWFESSITAFLNRDNVSKTVTSNLSCGHFEGQKATTKPAGPVPTTATLSFPICVVNVKCNPFNFLMPHKDFSIIKRIYTVIIVSTSLLSRPIMSRSGVSRADEFFFEISHSSRPSIYPTEMGHVNSLVFNLFIRYMSEYSDIKSQGVSLNYAWAG